MAVELNKANDQLSLFLALERDDRHDSRTIRSTIWYGLTGQIEGLHVFVDQWPSPSHICCLFGSDQFSKKVDYDCVVISTSNPELGSFINFFQAVAAARRWKERQGAVFQWIPISLVDLIAKSIAQTPTEGSIDVLKVARLFVCGISSDFQEYQTGVQQTIDQLPKGFTVGPLREEDAPTAAQAWKIEMPDKEAYVRWVIRQFPSICCRNENGVPVAWQFVINSGPGTSQYVVPELRGRNLNAIIGRKLLVEQTIVNPILPFGFVNDKNFPSLRSMVKYIEFLEPSDLLVVYATYSPAGENKFHFSKI